jgi:hypothetical protein
MNSASEPTYDPVEGYLQTIDQAMLQPVVRRMLGRETVEIDNWRCQPITEGSMVGSIVRLAGTGRDRAEHVPWSLILKFIPAPADNKDNHPLASSADPTGFLYWHRERLLYESCLFATLPEDLTVPECFGIDDQPGGYWLWLENIEDPDHRRWPLEHYAIAARHIGRFNGQYLAGREIPAWPWLTPLNQRMREIEKYLVGIDLWSQLPELRAQHAILRRAWPDGLLEEYHYIWQERARFFQALEGLPKTLKHDDFGNRNLFLRTRNGRHETVAIDWSCAGVGAVGEDLVPLVLSSVLWFGVSPSQYAELEQLAFEGYLQGLRDAGWHGDPQVVRLGYLALATLRFGTILMVPSELAALNEVEKAKAENLYGHPVEEIAENRAAMRRIVVACADEARTLMEG